AVVSRGRRGVADPDRSNRASARPAPGTPQNQAVAPRETLPPIRKEPSLGLWYSRAAKENCGTRRRHRPRLPRAVFLSLYFLTARGQAERENRTPSGVCFSPELAAERFNDRPANRETHSHSVRLRCVKWFE